MIKKYLSIFIVAILLISCGDSNAIVNEENIQDTSIVEKHGQLSISGTMLVDKNGELIVLRGMSLFWSQWGGNYYNEETIKWLRDDFKCTVVRLAMGVESGGYLDNSYDEYQKITSTIDACIKLGIYVIVDWHDHHAESHLNEAITFFNNISSTYGNQPNIIYEIYNEPFDISWSNVLKPYSQAVVNSIRANDSTNVIVVGTPNWSQDVDAVINNQIDDPNVAYSLHFYTGTHRQSLRDKATKAMNAGVPLFATEWGLSEANGTGAINLAESKLWTDFLEKNNLSWCNWSVMNKDESSAALLPTTSALTGWTEEQLTESGKMIRAYLIQENSNLFNN
ncbi:MAG: glycoside hydrolase family 5 protein [Melioribacteraceae bacterium]|nr:glycoside hydrolase family 5 protein [Melioribacteraceae bacterium]